MNTTKPRSNLLRWLPAVVAVAVTMVLAATVSNGDAATIGTVQSETMKPLQGYGTTVQSDRTASGGKRLKVWDNVTVSKTFTLSKATNQYKLRAKQDGNATGALIRVTVDGVNVGQWYVKKTSWYSYTVKRTVKAGKHTLRIQMFSAASRNLYLDYAQFNNTTVVTPTPTSPSPTTTPSPTPTSPSPTTTPPSNETRMTAFVTGYSWFDNTPPGSSDISHPVLHNKADGTGTYADPITMAVGHSLVGGKDILDWPAGTRFYIPNLRRYFIVEDTCGDGPTPQNGPCHTGYSAPATTWLDVWVGGENGTDAGDDACMEAITGNWTVIKNPAKDYAVVAGDIYGPSCTRQYGNTAVKA